MTKIPFPWRVVLVLVFFFAYFLYLLGYPYLTLAICVVDLALYFWMVSNASKYK